MELHLLDCGVFLNRQAVVECGGWRSGTMLDQRAGKQMKGSSSSLETKSGGRSLSDMQRYLEKKNRPKRRGKPGQC